MTADCVEVAHLAGTGADLPRASRVDLDFGGASLEPIDGTLSDAVVTFE